MTSDEQDQTSGAGEDPFGDFFKSRRKAPKKQESESDSDYEIFQDPDLDSQEEKDARPGIKGKDINLEVHISFEEAISGTHVELTYKKNDECSSCNGNKQAKGIRSEACRSCAGKGRISYKRGVMTISSVCTKCKGEGKSIRIPCQTCLGKGITQRTFSEKVILPKGINNGDYIKISKKVRLHPVDLQYLSSMDYLS